MSAEAYVGPPAVDLADQTIHIDEFKRTAERLAPGASDVIHALLGCTWGRTISIEGQHSEPCVAKADRIVVLHSGGDQSAFKLCDRHADVVEAQTDPHGEVADVDA